MTNQNEDYFLFCYKLSYFLLVMSYRNCLFGVKVSQISEWKLNG